MFHRRPVEAAFAAGKRPVRRKTTHRGSGARGQKSGIFIFKISSFRCSPRPYAHLCAGARAAVGPCAKRCKRRGGRPGGAASAGGGFGPIHVTAGLDVICSRSWFAMNICMSHNVGMAVIYMTPIIRRYLFLAPNLNLSDRCRKMALWHHILRLFRPWRRPQDAQSTWRHQG